MPASSMSGTPKLKTASVITEHEPVKRQVYTGAIGYIGLNGRSQFNVAVRTLLVRDSVAYLHTSARLISKWIRRGRTTGCVRPQMSF
jgi:anthranilate/para-aminobenzoate synthase component I